MQQFRSAQGWHTAKWGLWGWLETGVKAVGIVAGLVAFAQTMSAGAGPSPANNPRLAAIVVLALLTLAMLATVGIRLLQQEITSLVFAVFNALGHLGLLAAVVRAPDARTLPVVFGLFFVLGQVIKLRFLNVTGYTEGGANTAAMLRAAAVLGILYVLFAVFMLV